MKTLLITGTRHPLVAEHIRLIDNVFKHLDPPIYPGDILVHGDAPGVDRAVARYALDDWRMEECAHPADWAAYGKAAGPIRNQNMLVHHPDIYLVLAFPAPDSRGTWDMVERAVKARIPVRVYPLL